ncbi:Nuclear factor of activated T-cells 5 [Liparis tanakae]|uniref:Nuclear factor of activated T-cells 5 n=1 Tax=Liparis tanakae TaxID=230148 RepID=A0A4Z2JB91_9TELE|nr:Nuclear factor of activated T-cells 5 [Liparis tanakae]
MSSSMTMEGPRSAFPSSSSPTMHSSASASDQKSVHGSIVDPEDARSSRVVPEVVGAESGNGNGRSSAELGGVRGVTCQEAQPHHQMTPSKRRTVLNISPPPQDLLDNSQMSCQDETSLDSEQSNSIWMEDSLSNFSLMSSVSYNDNTEVPRKSRKRTPRQRPGPKSAGRGEASMDMFDADSAKGPHFVLSQLGLDNKTGSKGSSNDPQTTSHKGGILSTQYPQKSEGKEVKILVQPETQHRARYLTEGSRGSVKDRTQQGFPTVKLEGVNEPVVLQVFVGNDSGRVKPHGFYQACRVTGRNTTACKEVDIDGTTVIQVSLDQSTNMALAVDCVGILKLRNADVEARIGVAGSKKKSTRARLVFRVNIPRPDGSVLTLQIPSSPILCNDKSWKAEAEIDMELFHQNHVIVKVPPYQNQAITSSVCVGIYVMTNAGRSHDVQPFTYTPHSEPLGTIQKQDIAATSSFSVPAESLLQQGSQQFLLEPREGLGQESMVTVNLQDRSEPMALGNPNDPRQQVIFQEQQPMQLGSSSSNQQEQPVGLFMPQSNMASLQGALATQELAQSAMFASQNGVANLQTTTSSPVQQPGNLFQTAVSGSINQPSRPQQPGLFLFGIQNECDQLMNTPGTTLSDQIIAISQSGQNQRESDAHIQSLLNQSLSQSGPVQSSMNVSQNMEKMDDLLVSLQESGSNLTRSY